jgi:hypothetical protein
MQAALYDYTENSRSVELYSDLNSKKGDKKFLLQMKKWIIQYEDMWKAWNGKLLPSDQFTFLTFDPVTQEIAHPLQHAFNNAIFIALLKGRLKNEIQLRLPTESPDTPIPQPKIWKIAPGELASSWDDALESNEIFVGWSDLGDLSQYDSRAELMVAYKEVYKPEQEPIRNVFTLWSFLKDVQIGDIVIANRGWKQLVGIGKIIGNYEYNPNKDYPNRRKVEWVITDEIHFDENVFSTPTLTPVHDHKINTIQKEVSNHITDGEAKWQKLFGEIFIDEQDSYIDDFIAFLKSRQFYFSRDFVIRFITSLQAKPFTILSGMSGTGKTKIAQLFTDYLQLSNKGKSPKKKTIDTEHKTFKLTVQPYYLKYSRMIVPVDILEWILLEHLEDGVEIDLSFAGKKEKALIKKTIRGHVRLGFRKRFYEWLKAEFQAGAEIRLTIYDEGALLAFGPVKEDDELSEDNLAFLSVRPDWLDHRGLLGTYNPLSEKYEATPLLKIMLRAEQNPTKPYFVILDEMNLSRVEYYFSDYLSCIESRRVDEEGEVYQESIILHNQPNDEIFIEDNGRVYSLPNRLQIPVNLYIIGTVNIDESTYMFSPKVLDRANVLECNKVDLSSYWNEDNKEMNYKTKYSLDEKNNWFTYEGDFHSSLYQKEYRQKEWKEDLDEVYSELVKMHELMEEEGYSFGYRVVDEIMTYLTITKWHEYCSLEEAFDAQIIQKVMPKLYGNRKQMEQLLLKLVRFTIGEHTDANLLTSEEKDILEFEEFYRYPLSGKKAFAMYKQLMKTGYTSFIS